MAILQMRFSINAISNAVNISTHVLKTPDLWKPSIFPPPLRWMIALATKNGVMTKEWKMDFKDNAGCF
jgi:hypothetical protein